ncbi:acetyltransferase [Lophiostoma macrostomum CBS 122681]|uniref:Acetyltransferase n=1 Tax=Lophiostoma macrostomum CBS 122681 TaxID=1314788 RepID=A0A6A6SMR5_9PLEO|nr:acetyltransferase [Lophiostoma macrostomum CBS 122681]
MEDVREWNRTVGGQSFLVSNSRDLFPHEFAQRAFATTDMSWATSMPPEKMKTALENSCTVAVYKSHTNGSSDQTQHSPVGMARLSTDYVTFAYLTDVFILEEYRKLGLGQWLIQCCGDLVVDMPYLRWMMLLTGSEHAERMYERELGMQRLGIREDGLISMGAKKVHLQAAGRGAHPQGTTD